MRRTRTNTPLQALVTLNDQVYVEAAQALARRILVSGGDTTASRAEYGFRLALTRPPTDVELLRVVALCQSVHESLSAEPNKAATLATKPIGALPDKMDVIDAASWTVLGNVFMNLDEFRSKP